MPNTCQPNVFLLHGFNVSDGGVGSVGKLLPYLPGSRIWPYGWMGLFGVWFFNGRIARMLAASLDEGCTVIGHSNAAAIIYRALQLDSCPHIKRVVLIRPALDSDVVFGVKVDRVDVFYHNGDLPTKLSSWLPWHEWGSMGASGYTGNELHVVNHDSGLMFGEYGHSHSAFANESFGVFVKYLRKLLGIDDV